LGLPQSISNAAPNPPPRAQFFAVRHSVATPDTRRSTIDFRLMWGNWWTPAGTEARLHWMRTLSRLGGTGVPARFPLTCTSYPTWATPVFCSVATHAPS